MFLTTAEVAARLHRTPATVRAWCRQGKLKAEVCPSGRGYLIPADALPGRPVETETAAERKRRARAAWASIE